MWSRVSSFLIFGICIVALAGCGARSDLLTPVSAQPKTPVARNFTSFQPALQCMDGLFARSGKKGVRISSTGIPDSTGKVKVGADDMLINAINHMTRNSHAYQFLDQAQIRWGEIFEIQINDPEIVADLPKPRYYIRGTISQLDSDARGLRFNDGIDITNTASDGRVVSSTLAPNRNSSVISVDLHLVSFPSRRILPGASVSNSMVVTSNTWGVGWSGEINKSELGLKLQISRVESMGQAVRSLIELGAIELLGRHADVPYWTCLSLPANNARATAQQERVFVMTDATTSTTEAQALLVRLGRTEDDASPADVRRAIAKYQADRALIASGEADFDTLRQLRREVARLPAPVEPAVVAPKPATVAQPIKTVPKPAPVQTMSEAEIAEDFVPLRRVRRTPNPVTTQQPVLPPDEYQSIDVFLE